MLWVSWVPHQFFLSLVPSLSPVFLVAYPLPQTASLYDLLSCYGDIQSNARAETLTIVASRLYSVEEASNRLRHLLLSMADWTKLQNFLPSNLSESIELRSATASHFAASLELARDGLLRLRQDSHFAPIYLKSREQA